jgi:hypothetical protein
MPTPDPAAKPSAPQGDQTLAFGEEFEDRSWKAIIFRPFTLAAAALLVGILLFIAFLEQGSIDRSLPLPEITYSLQRNEGVTSGVPIAIKMNQVTVFLIDDPMESGTGAERAKTVVENLQIAVQLLQNQPGKTVTLDINPELPAIVISRPDGTERRTLIQLQPGDLTLVGETDGKRVARIWAERLTDAIKVFVFGEPPKFSKGTEFGDSMDAMYASAMQYGGAISKSSLDFAFTALNDRQKQALETLPILSPAPAQEQQ